MITLGNIVYSNCYPVHAAILDQSIPFPFKIVDGVPTELNRYLIEGKVDVSPSSSIEYALNPGKYRLLPDLSIASRTKVMSILLESRFPLHGLDKKIVALTTASATSVVLLRIILELFEGINPNFSQYDQGNEDPYAGADAVLTIGDLALQRTPRPDFPHLYDLGEVWHSRTGLPFVFALWQVHYKKSLEPDLSRLYDILQQSKRWGLARLPELAQKASERFGLAPELLLGYWTAFSYDFGREEQNGLLAYYGYAAELGIIDAVPELKFVRAAKE